MTNQTSIDTKRLSLGADMPADVLAPPSAPLMMPKQMLQSGRPLLPRLIGWLLTPVAMLKPGSRRIG